MATPPNFGGPFGDVPAKPANDGNEGNFWHWLSQTAPDSVGRAANNVGFGAPASGPFAASNYQAAGQGVLSPDAQAAALGQVQQTPGADMSNLQGAYGNILSGYNLFAQQANGGGPDLAAQEARQAGQQNESQALGL